MKRTMSRLPWILAAMVLVALMTYGFWPEPVRVELTEVVRGKLEVTVDDDGETRIREKYIVSAPVVGKLLRVQLEAGDRIERGVTELARIEPNMPSLLDARTQAEAEARLSATEAALKQSEAGLNRAKEALELADHEFTRARELLVRRAVSQADFDSTEHAKQMAEAELRSAEFAVRVASFELELARATAANYDRDPQAILDEPLRLISPIDGQVLRVFLEDAVAVIPSAPILQVGDLQDLEIEIDVLSTEAVRIQPGDNVYIEHWGGDDTLRAKVRTVEPSAFLKISALGVEEKRVNVIADFVDPWSCRTTLGDGFRVEARIVVESTTEDSLKIAAGALFREMDEWKVFRVVDGVTELCSVEIGASNGIETVILSGLDESDVVVLHPSSEVRHGIRVD